MRPWGAPLLSARLALLSSPQGNSPAPRLRPNTASLARRTSRRPRQAARVTRHGPRSVPYGPLCPGKSALLIEAYGWPEQWTKARPLCRRWGWRIEDFSFLLEKNHLSEGKRPLGLSQLGWEASERIRLPHQLVHLGNFFTALSLSFSLMRIPTQ